MAGKIDEQTEERPHTEHIPPVMKEEVEQMKRDNCLLSCKHVADKVSFLKCVGHVILVPGTSPHIPCDDLYLLLEVNYLIIC